MTLADLRAAVFQGTVFTGTLLLIAMGVLLVLLCITFLLRIFFRKHPFVNNVHKVLIYLLTMTGVLALLLAGAVGAVLPVIPGIVFVFIAVLLMRKYHRWRWLDRQMVKVTRGLKKTSLGKRYFAWRAAARLARIRRKEEKLREKQLKIQEKLNKLREERNSKR